MNEVFLKVQFHIHEIMRKCIEMQFFGGYEIALLKTPRSYILYILKKVR